MSPKRGDRAAPPPHPEGSLSTDLHAGQDLPQWQYEVAAGGRIWYLVDDVKHICWIKFASTSHPKVTD
jgi:hypothetical protein